MFFLKEWYLVSALLNTWESVCVTSGMMCTSHLYSTVQLWDVYLGLCTWKKRPWEEYFPPHACPTQHKATAFLSGGGSCVKPVTKSKAANPEPYSCILRFLFLFGFFFSSWESASGHISGCQRLWVQRHSTHGAPEGEGREDPCSGSWHDQVGTEIPGGKCDETVCFGCSCDRGCSEVNGTFHSTGVIFFFSSWMSYFPPRDVVMPSSCGCSPCGLSSSSELCKQVELGCSSWELCNCQQLESFFQGKIPPYAGSIFQTRIVLSHS